MKREFEGLDSGGKIINLNRAGSCSNGEQRLVMIDILRMGMSKITDIRPEKNGSFVAALG